jgi:hypothetical protein
MDGSGYVKPEDPDLEVRNNCALAALMAAREEQDAALQSMWTGGAGAAATAGSFPMPVHTVPPSDTCFEVDGHFYKIPDVDRANELQKSLAELAEARAKEEAAWAAHWTDPSAVSVPVKPAWENDIVLKDAPVEHVSDLLVAEPEPETKTETDTDLPQIEVSELS